MNHHTSSRQRKSGNKCVITRKQPRSRNCSILSSSNTLVCLRSNTALVSLTPLHIGLVDQTTLLTTDHHHNYLLADLAATITIKRPVAVVRPVQTGTLLGETKPVVIVIIRAVEVMVADRILHKVEVVHHMVALVLEDLAVAMVLDHLTTHKVVVVVSTVALEEVRTQWVVLETNNMDGNSKHSHVVWSGLDLSQRQL